MLFFFPFLRPLRLVRPQTQYSKRHLTAVKTDHPPVIDGDLSDACWKTAGKAEQFVDVQNGNLVADQTIAYLLYDDKYIYIAFDCRDAHPELITARETVRDMKFQQNNNNGNNQNNEDNIEVDFDPFLTHQGNDVSQFSVNALGTRSAALAGGRGSKAEWKGDWDTAVKRSKLGWTCEIRIPWVSLNYPSGKKAVSMGIDFQRFQDRTKVQSMWSNVTTQGFIELEGVWDNVQVPQAAFKQRLSLLPYLLTGIQDNQTSSKIGLDARIHPDSAIDCGRELQSRLFDSSRICSKHHLFARTSCRVRSKAVLLRRREQLFRSDQRQRDWQFLLFKPDSHIRPWCKAVWKAGGTRLDRTPRHREL